MFLNIEEKSITNHKLLIINHNQLLQVNLKLRLLETFVLDYLLQTPNIETKKKNSPFSITIPLCPKKSL